MRKVYNFSAGPAMLPEEVLLKAQSELLDWHETGMSIMELGHRGPEFQDVAEKAEQDLRDLMKIPHNYDVLFMPGGASLQFSLIPLNLLKTKKQADYIDTGIWSKKAIAEGKRYGNINVVSEIETIDGLKKIPDEVTWHLNKNAAYFHYTPNETIEGIEFKTIPQQQEGIPLIADMSSMILSRPVDVSKFGLIYAGAQKNIGQAGITVVIIRKDLIQEAPEFAPILCQYKVQAENHSFYNTPPTFSWYIAGLVFEWLKKKGGVETIYEINQRKAKKLYHFIDQSEGFYHSQVHPSCRSLMNIPINLKDENLNQLFLAQSAEVGLTNLKGHRLAGGIRASIYNAMPEEGVDQLIDFMKLFVKKYG